jgi:hypothetical protein
MATVYSNQRTNDVATPPVPNNPNTDGRVKRKYFEFDTALITVNSGDTIELCKVPIKARITGGYIAFEAFGASTTLAIGVSGTTGKYLGATSVAAIGQSSFANTVALNFGEELAAEITLIGTAAGANFAATKKCRGYIEYISAGE